MLLIKSIETITEVGGKLEAKLRLSKTYQEDPEEVLVTHSSLFLLLIITPNIYLFLLHYFIVILFLYLFFVKASRTLGPYFREHALLLSTFRGKLER